MMERTILLFSLLLLFSGSIWAQCANSDPTSPVGIIPITEIFPGGDPSCGFRISNLNSDTTINLGFGNQLILDYSEDSTCGPVFQWTVIGSIVMDTIWAKGGTDQNVYIYTNENPSPTTDGYLHAPVNNSGKYAGLSHVDFCLSYKLDVSKTAVTSLDRTYEWDIDKSCDGEDTLDLQNGQSYAYPFSWTASVVDSADTNWLVEGTIKVKNATPYDVTIDSLTDIITGGLIVTLDCNSITFPYQLLSGDSIMCTYSQVLPDASARTNKFIAYSGTTEVKGDSDLVNFDFNNPGINAFDTTLAVKDECEDTIYVNISQAPFTHEYTCDISFSLPECIDTNYINRVFSLTNDTETTDSDSCVVEVRLHGCDDGGCTLTPGYWKTHSQLGPAPYDSTWEDLGVLQEQTMFFISGQTYYVVLWTPPQGNVYYISAHAYIAAELNALNGVVLPADVQEAFDSLTNFFTNTTPQAAALIKGAAKNKLTGWAALLDSFNNGLEGPLHCSESTTQINKSENPESGDNGNQGNNMPMEVIPDNYSLAQNYPNPFNPATTIRFGLPVSGFVSLKVYDLLGNEIATLVEQNISAGIHSITFDASDYPSGVYLYKIQSGDFVQTKKMILMK